jgi:outer membrane immunogenic protein
VETEIIYFGTLRGNLGYTFGNTLVFATGGFLVVNHSGRSFVDLNGDTATGSDTASLRGWVAGLGVEHRFSDRISLSATWLNHQSDSETYSIDQTEAAASGGEDHRIDVDYKSDDFRLALNYHF